MSAERAPWLRLSESAATIECLPVARNKECETYFGSIGQERRSAQYMKKGLLLTESVSTTLGIHGSALAWLLFLSRRRFVEILLRPTVTAERLGSFECTRVSRRFAGDH